LEDYNQAILLDENDALAYRQRATLYQEIGELEKASADFRAAERAAQRVFPVEGG
jgi:Tfp pilus assembly protein PilF